MSFRTSAICVPTLLALLILCNTTTYAQRRPINVDVPPTAGGDPTHIEVAPIKVSLGSGGKIETMAMDHQQRLLLAVSSNAASRNSIRRRGARGPAPGERQYSIKFVNDRGTVVDEWRLDDQVPKMVHAMPDGDIYVAGMGRMTCYDASGRPKHSISFADLYDGYLTEAHASGITANEDYVFLAFGDGWSLRATEEIHRFQRDLTGAKQVVERQYGCCAHLDLDIRNGELLIAENSRHRVNRFSLDGELLGRWGRRDRTSIKGFAACCNPVNFDFAADNVLYTAESGVGRVKKYSPDGEYLGLVGYVDTTKFDRGSRLAAQSCYIPIEIGPNADRIYVMDVRANFVRVLERIKS